MKKRTAVSCKDKGFLTSPPERAKITHFLTTFIEPCMSVLNALFQKNV